MPANRFAIIGLGCRLPGDISHLDHLWDVLIQGIDAVTEIPAYRWSKYRFLHALRSAPGRSCTFSAGVINDIDYFDPDFFGISRNEAQFMDPQQRLLLEMAWEALEDANLPPSSIAGKDVGVYIGASSMDACISRADDPCFMGPYSMTGSSFSIISNRLSYIFDLKGPSLTIDTACSSSLVALHQACRAMEHDGLSLAIAGGVNMLYSPLPFIGFSKAHMLSENGRCKVFDKDGNGYVRAEGGGLVIIKPLDRAMEDGDNIHAIIEATGVNTDGRTAGMAFPSREAQEALLRKIYGPDGFDPSSLSYMEAHGTGTAAGDPVETGSIGSVLGKARPEDDPLLVGSVKSNIGHLEPASGMAGLFKSLLVLRHGDIPANLHLNEPHPSIDFKGLNLSPVTSFTPLDKSKSHLVGVNSFGFGGVNAHVLLASPPSRKDDAKDESSKSLPPLFLTARSEASLRSLAGAWATALEDIPVEECAGLISGAAHFRDHLRLRLAVQAESGRELAERLAAFAEQGTTNGVLVSGEAPSERPSVALVFSGNGSQWPGMGQALMESDPVFADAVDTVDALFTPLAGWSIREELAKAPEDNRLELTEVAQPLLFALQVGLVESLAARGFKGNIFYGHSVGEVAAAYASGALNLEQAVQVIFLRSSLQGETSGTGRMAAVNMPAEEALKLDAVTSGKVELGATNSHGSITLTGDEEALQALEKEYTAKGVFFRILGLDYPFHSRFMLPLKDRFEEGLKDLAPHPCKGIFVSTVSGDTTPGEALDADYWWGNIRRPVAFAQATGTAMDLGARIFLEIGPHGVLQYYLRETTRELGSSARCLSTLVRDENCSARFEQAWKEAYVNGFNPDLSVSHPHVPDKSLRLPSYPWDQVYLNPDQSPESNQVFKASDPTHFLLGDKKPGGMDIWESAMDTEILPILGHHVVSGSAIFPAAGYLEMALAAASQVLDTQAPTLEQVAFVRPLPLSGHQTRNVRLHYNRDEGGFRIESRPQMSGEGWVTHAVGRIPSRSDALELPPLDCAANPESFGRPVDTARLYQAAARSGLEFGRAFRPMRQAWLGDEEVLVELSLDTSDFDFNTGEEAFLHPCLIDGSFQTLLVLLTMGLKTEVDGLYLPSRVGRLQAVRQGRPALIRSRVEKISHRSVQASFLLYDRDGGYLARLDHCRFTRLDASDATRPDQECYSMAMVPVSHPLDNSPAPFPAPGELAAGAAATLEDILDEYGRADLYEAVQPLSQAALISLGYELLFPLADSDGMLHLSSLTRHLGEDSQFMPYVVRLLEIMESDELAFRDGDSWRLASGNEMPAFDDLWRTINADYPEHLPNILALIRIKRFLSTLLDPDASLSTMPRGGDEVLDHAQAYGPDKAFYIRMLREVLDLANAAADSSRRVRILELEAGTGNLAEQLLPFLDSGRTHYTLADPSQDMVDAFANRWAELGHVDSVLLDMADNTPSPVGLGGRFDIILCGKVLSRAHDPYSTLKSIRSLLRPNGLLLALEDTPTPLTDLIQGMEEWWWDYSPSQSEPVSHLFGEGQWAELLTECGFQSQAVLREPLVEDPLCYVLLAGNGAQEAASDSEPPATEGRMLVIAEDADPSPCAAALATALADAFEAWEIPVARIRIGERLDRVSETEYTVTPDDMETWTSAFSSLGSPGASMDVVHLSGMDTDTDISQKRMDSLATDGTICAAMAAKGLAASGRKASFWMVAGGAHCLLDRGGRPVPSQGSRLGLMRVISNEMPQLNAHFLDVHAEHADAAMLSACVRDIAHPTEEREVVMTPSGRFCPRVTVLETGRNPDQGTDGKYASTLVFDAPGKLDRLYWRKKERNTPGEGEVEIRTRAVGLNFRDIMFTLGLLPDEAVEDGFAGASLGLECSGEVISVGPGVTHLKAGDKVLSMTGSSFSSHITTTAEVVHKMPETLSFSQAATIPATFFTAWYSLKHLANLQPGERVLIHGGAGGVGLAAIQVAFHLGAEVYATAGAPDKQDLVRHLGVEHVFQSRDLTFADRIMELTGGQGVDVVLNSLAGEFLFKSLEILRPMGRFLELGKRDFYANTPLRMRDLRRNIAFHGVDVDQIMLVRPELGRTLFQEIVDLFEDSVFTPLPHSIYPRRQTVDGFRAMQQALHVGKLVVAFDEAEHDVRPAAQDADAGQPTLPLSRDASYLVTGGVSGFGMATARRMAENGAGSLILASRSGAGSDERKASLKELEKLGATVTVLAVDVSDGETLKDLLDKALNDLPPLRGVVHAAAVLDDAVLANLTPDRFASVLRAKALGAWNLHLATLSRTLDFFIMYSSATTVLGNPGQANYVAANTMLEALAAHRRQQGLPGLAVGWGPISDTGMLTRSPKVLDSLKQVLGVRELPSALALDFLALLSGTDSPMAAVFGINWRKIRSLPLSSSPMLRAIPELARSEGDRESMVDPRAIIEDLPRPDAILALAEMIAEELAAILRIPVGKIAQDQPVSELGMDSLMAVELGLAMEERFGVTTGGLSLGESASVLSIAEKVYRQLSDTGDDKDTDEDDLTETMRNRHGVDISSESAQALMREVEGDLDKQTRMIQ